MWVYRTNTSAFDWVFGSFDGALLNGFAYSFYNEGSQGQIDAYIGIGGSYTRVKGGGSHFNSAWEHIAMTHDSSGSGSTTVYLNGKPITATFGSNPMTGTVASPENWCLGSAGVWNLERFNGYIDQARFYDTDLTAAEIELLYNETANATTGTIGSNTWSSFIGGTGTISFTASSGSGRPTSPTEGLMRENTTTGKMEFYNGTIWEEINDTANSYSPGVIPSANFNTVLYTGTNATQSISTVGFEPGMVWFKNKAGTNSHAIVDSVRTRSKYIYPDDSSVENTSAASNDMTSFDSNGFSLGAVSQADSTNTTTGGTNNIVAWSWKGGGAATTITAGTVSNDISSDVSANTAAGFSIVKYTGNGSAGATIAHGLGGSPEIVFSKSLDSTYDWGVFNYSLPTNYTIKLNTDGNAFDGSADTNGGAYTVSSTLLTVVGGSSTSNNNNASGDDFIAYCWRSIPGYSKIGFYVGGQPLNTTTQMYFGFTPAWILIKNTTDSSSQWMILDNKRTNGYAIYANQDVAESDYTTDILLSSNGLEFKSNNINVNKLGSIYIYMAFSE